MKSEILENRENLADRALHRQRACPLLPRRSQDDPQLGREGRDTALSDARAASSFPAARHLGFPAQVRLPGPRGAAGKQAEGGGPRRGSERARRGATRARTPFRGHRVRRPVRSARRHRRRAAGRPRSDLALPGIDALRFLERLKAIEATAPMRLIVYSAQDQQRRAALEAGANDFVSKGEIALLARVDRALDGARSRLSEPAPCNSEAGASP